MHALQAKSINVKFKDLEILTSLTTFTIARGGCLIPQYPIQVEPNFFSKVNTKSKMPIVGPCHLAVVRETCFRVGDPARKSDGVPSHIGRCGDSSTHWTPHPGPVRLTVINEDVGMNSVPYSRYLYKISHKRANKVEPFFDLFITKLDLRSSFESMMTAILVAGHCCCIRRCGIVRVSQQFEQGCWRIAECRTTIGLGRSNVDSC